MTALLGIACTAALAGADLADGHPPSSRPVSPPRVVEEIPDGDLDQYRSRVISIEPAVPGLRAAILDGQEELEVSWTGRPQLVVEGYRGEPMLRMSGSAVEVNRRSPSAYLSGDRYAAVSVPGRADPAARPLWRPLASPGPISWFEHRAQWMRAERPAIVGDGSSGVTILHWRVPARLGDRRVSIRGVLEWLPDAEAVRAERSETSSPLLAAGLLAGAAALGAAAGFGLRRREESKG